MSHSDRSQTTERIVEAVALAARLGSDRARAAALHCVEPDALAVFFHDSVTDHAEPPLTTGLGASPGAASGVIALSSAAAVAAAEAGTDAILVCTETGPGDMIGIRSARGVVTTRGGVASHAAIVARGWEIPAVVGATGVTVDAAGVTIGDVHLTEGSTITVDGTTGAVHLGRLPATTEAPPVELTTLLGWADDVARGKVAVWANADTERDAIRARTLGAQGIGLCRTEHLFLTGDRLDAVQAYLAAPDSDAGRRALAAMEQMQATELRGLLRAAGDAPVRVRLFDAPVHEFLAEAREANPMLGLRGVRLGLVQPELYAAQARALVTAIVEVHGTGGAANVEVLVPLVAEPGEVRAVRSIVNDAVGQIGGNMRAAIRVGAMIETPRAALLAGALAGEADFVSFGTNDLTQLTFGFSRDDVEARLLPRYEELALLPENPFATLDRAGVGELIRMAVGAARSFDPSLRVGACGEHAGDPDSIAFLTSVGIDSLSCAPSRVPVARLAVAQALLHDADRARRGGDADPDED